MKSRSARTRNLILASTTALVAAAALRRDPGVISGIFGDKQGSTAALRDFVGKASTLSPQMQQYLRSLDHTLGDDGHQYQIYGEGHSGTTWVRNLVEKLLDQHCKNSGCTLDRSIPKEIHKIEASVGIVRQAWQTGFKSKVNRGLPFSIGDLVTVAVGPLKNVITKHYFATVSDETPDAKQRIEIQYVNSTAPMKVGVPLQVISTRVNHSWLRPLVAPGKKKKEKPKVVTSAAMDPASIKNLTEFETNGANWERMDVRMIKNGKLIKRVSMGHPGLAVQLLCPEPQRAQLPVCRHGIFFTRPSPVGTDLNRSRDTPALLPGDAKDRQALKAAIKHAQEGNANENAYKRSYEEGDAKYTAEYIEAYARHSMPLSLFHSNEVGARRSHIFDACIAAGIGVHHPTCVSAQQMLPALRYLAAHKSYIALMRDPRSILVSALKQCGDLGEDLAFCKKYGLEENSQGGTEDRQQAWVVQQHDAANRAVKPSNLFLDIVLWTGFRYFWFTEVLGQVAPVLTLLFEDMKADTLKETKRIKEFLQLNVAETKTRDIATKRLDSKKSNIRSGHAQAFLNDLDQDTLEYCAKLMKKHLHRDLLRKWKTDVKTTWCPSCKIGTDGLLIKRKPLFKVGQHVKVLRKNGWEDLADLPFVTVAKVALTNISDLTGMRVDTDFEKMVEIRYPRSNGKGSITSKIHASMLRPLSKAGAPFKIGDHVTLTADWLKALSINGNGYVTVASQPDPTGMVTIQYVDASVPIAAGVPLAITTKQIPKEALRPLIPSPLAPTPVLAAGFNVGDRVAVTGGPLKGVITDRTFATVSNEQPDAKGAIEVQYVDASKPMAFGVPVAILTARVPKSLLRAAK